MLSDSTNLCVSYKKFQIGIPQNLYTVFIWKTFFCCFHLILPNVKKVVSDSTNSLSMLILFLFETAENATFCSKRKLVGFKCLLEKVLLMKGGSF